MLLKTFSFTMKTILLALLAVLSLTACPERVTDLKLAVAKAKTEGKILFVMESRDGCGNCDELKAMIKSNRLRLNPADFVFADVNVDDAATDALFMSLFKVEGTQLPFVAIAAPDGTQLAAHSGAATEKEFEDLVNTAKLAARKRRLQVSR